MDSESENRTLGNPSQFIALEKCAKNPAYAQMPVYGILDQGDVRGLLALVNNPKILSIEP
ncbi:MAG TPA: hypothetical protein VJM81_00225 [Rhizorhapis sp.]|uniref:hypothetical protein n=1 Tax=Rhizorhapis sp. TaxID=1968842 RepID=UPI002B499F45|nr:hypothetical protein [Rhizorhapis sp.]HKX21676.1 hypothetical protein [Rhizorhapis sp.]